MPLTTICGVPSDDSEPSTTEDTTPLVVLLEFASCNVTVLPIRLFACMADNDEDIALVWVNDVNCAICDAMSVSDSGFKGSWFSIWATRSCRKSF